MQGGKSRLGEGYVKRNKMCHEHVPTTHNDCFHGSITACKYILILMM